MLHPQTRGLLRLIEEKGIPPTHKLTPSQARVSYSERRAVTQPNPPEVGLVRNLRAGQISMRLYRPMGSEAERLLPVLVFFHGGGWLLGDLETHDTLCRQLANGSGCAVVSVDYRLAPEHRFPAAVEDAVSATRWVRQNAAAHGLDPDRVAVGGDSAGGNLAAVVAITARDAGDLPIAFQLLIYPATDQRRVAPSHQANGEGYVLTHDTMRYFQEHYIEDKALHEDWRASPLLHPDLSHLPPALVVTAGFDPLRDEGMQYADKLSEAGNRATLVCFERQIHGFITMGKVIDEANVGVQFCASQIRQALSA